MNGLVQFELCTLTDQQLVEKVDALINQVYITGKITSHHIRGGFVACSICGDAAIDRDLWDNW